MKLLMHNKQVTERTKVELTHINTKQVYIIRYGG